MSKLYNGARDPSKKTLGTGYGSRLKAVQTLKIIKTVPKTKQTQIVVTMFNRAKFHKYQTPGMRSAMKVFAKWLKERNIKYSLKL